MVTRKQAQQKALACANEMIRTNGGNSTAVSSPLKGKKCSWTWNEYKEAVINDCNLLDEHGNEIKGMNPIDDMYNYLVYAQEHCLPSSEKN